MPVCGCRWMPNKCVNCVSFLYVYWECHCHIYKRTKTVCCFIFLFTDLNDIIITTGAATALLLLLLMVCVTLEVATTAATATVMAFYSLSFLLFAHRHIVRTHTDTHTHNHRQHGRNIFTHFWSEHNEGKHVKHLALDNKLWHIIIFRQYNTHRSRKSISGEPLFSLTRTTDMHDYIMVVRKFPHFIFAFCVRRSALFSIHSFVLSFIHSFILLVFATFSTHTHTQARIYVRVRVPVYISEVFRLTSVSWFLFLFHLCSYEFMCTNKFLPSFFSEWYGLHEYFERFQHLLPFGKVDGNSVFVLCISKSEARQQTAAECERKEASKKVGEKRGTTTAGFIHMHGMY